MEKKKYSDAFLLTRGMLSFNNEYHVLKILANIARIRLLLYKNSYQENVKIMKDNSIPMFTNYRNTIAFVRLIRME